MSYLIRVSLPDRPGSLGRLATALGDVEADIISLDVVERRADGCAVDDILVSLPLGGMADSLVSAAHSVPGVRVQFLRRYTGVPDLHRDLEALEAMTEEPEQAPAVLTELVPGVFWADWAVLLKQVGEQTTVVHTSDAAPDCRAIAFPPLARNGASILDLRGWAPGVWQDTTVAAVPLGGSGQVLLLGRMGGPQILASELARLRHLAGLAVTVQLAATAPSLPPAS